MASRRKVEKSTESAVFVAMYADSGKKGTLLEKADVPTYAGLFSAKYTWFHILRLI